MSAFNWRGASSVFAGAQAGRKAGLTGTRKQPVRGWRQDNQPKGQQ